MIVKCNKFIRRTKTGKISYDIRGQSTSKHTPCPGVGKPSLDIDIDGGCCCCTTSEIVLKFTCNECKMEIPTPIGFPIGEQLVELINGLIGKYIDEN